MRKIVCLMSMLAFMSLGCTVSMAAPADTDDSEAAVTANEASRNPFVTYDYYTGEPVEPDDGFSSDGM